MDKGLAHEEACLAEFEARGRSVFRTPGREDHETFAQWVSRVGNPMEDGWDVIYQFPMVHDGLRGIADFLVRVPDPTRGLCHLRALRRQAGPPGGEARSCPPALLLRRRHRGADRVGSAQMHLWLGSGEIESLEVEQFGAYWRRLRRRLAAVIADPGSTAFARRSAPTASSASTPSSARTSGGPPTRWYMWPASGRRRRTPSRLPTSPRSLELAEAGSPVPGVQPPGRIDFADRPNSRWSPERAPDAPPAFRPVPPGEDPVWGHGYANLPEPDPGDVYFDLEGHPFWTASAGLFFLFGLWYQRGWRMDLRGPMGPRPRRAGCDGRRPCGVLRPATPGTSRTSTCTTTTTPNDRPLAAMTLGRPSEALFTHLSDTGLFVDLMEVATNSFQVGVESYGLKSLEVLAGYQRQGDIEGGVGRRRRLRPIHDHRRPRPPRGNRPVQRGRCPGHPGAPRLATRPPPAGRRVAGAGARRIRRRSRAGPSRRAAAGLGSRDPGAPPRGSSRLLAPGAIGGRGTEVRQARVGHP